MTNCPGCATPDRGIFEAGCRDCAIRFIALGPHFFDSLRRGRITAEYAAQLKTLGDIEAVHREVKAAAKATHTGAQG